MPRLPIPPPALLQEADSPAYVTYLPGEETISQYCDYIQELCHAYSQSPQGNHLFVHPLSICHFMINGLPWNDTWTALKIAYSHLVILNQNYVYVPNTSYFGSPPYSPITPEYIRGRIIIREDWNFNPTIEEQVEPEVNQEEDHNLEIYEPNNYSDAGSEGVTTEDGNTSDSDSVNKY